MVSSKLSEPHWFDWHVPPGELRDGVIEEKNINAYLSDYRNHAFNMTYIKQHPKKRTFEKTPSYMFEPMVPNRIKSTVPHAKIIMLLRDPLERAYSHYKMAKFIFAQGNIKTFEDCIEFDIKLLKWAGIIPQDEHMIQSSLTLHDLDQMEEAWINYTKKSKMAWAKCGSIIGRGIYALQLRMWWKAYDEEERRDNFLVMRSEDLRPDEDGRVHLKNVTDLMGVADKMVINYPVVIHRTFGIREMQNETKNRLRRLYEPFNDVLEQYLGSSWHDPWSWKEAH